MGHVAITGVISYVGVISGSKATFLGRFSAYPDSLVSWCPASVRLHRASLLDQTKILDFFQLVMAKHVGS